LSRILAIDYGARRTGLAVTDPLQIIAGALTTVETKELIPFLKKYMAAEPVERILIGAPLNLDGSPTHATPLVAAAVKQLTKEFPQVPIQEVDEQFTSKRAKHAMVEMGMKKKDRRVKGNTDRIAAAIMLQEYLENPQRG